MKCRICKTCSDTFIVQYKPFWWWPFWNTVEDFWSEEPVEYNSQNLALDKAYSILGPKYDAEIVWRSE